MSEADAEQDDDEENGIEFDGLFVIWIREWEIRIIKISISY